MELAVGAGLAPLECSAAVEKCPKLGWWRLSEPKRKIPGSTRVGSVYTKPSGRTQNGNPCAGINRHEAENARVLRERGSDPLGLEFCVRCREVSGEA
jgi:hypothetical protein